MTKEGIIYMTINCIDGKRYIGLDTNNDVCYFGSGYLLKRAIKKYGKNNFIKIILYKSKDEPELRDKEIYYIDLYKAHKNMNFYNLSNIIYNGERTGKIKIYQYSVKGRFINEYNSIKEAAIKNNICRTNLNRDTKNDMFTYKKGYIWGRNKINKIPYKKIDEIINKYYHRSVYKYDLNGKFLKKYNSIEEAAKSVGKIAGNISACCKFKVNTTGGYYWQYDYYKELPDYILYSLRDKHAEVQKRKIMSIDKNNNINYYESISEAANKLNTSRSNISLVLNGKNKTAVGCKWKYLNVA